MQAEPDAASRPRADGDPFRRARPPTDDPEELRAAARRIRRRALQMVAPAGAGYLGQAFSSAELFAVLYRSVLRHGWDRFVLSPGHYVIAHYAAAAEAGLLDEEDLASYGADGSPIESISSERTPLVAATCGSLGQELSVAAGLALADQLAGVDRRVFVLCSDGELEEGQTWEAAMFAAHHRLGSLVAVVDCNGSQVDGAVSTVTTLEPLADKWRAFGWHAEEVDGHDVVALDRALAAALADSRPSAVVARTSVVTGPAGLVPAGDSHFVKVTPDQVAQALAALDGPAGGGAP
ncbi:MAG TPA: 1-deoxy-D-xylulose-5-phosphate synthase N-terminal domain-containing protein [Acidimicrobiales bacterium]|nr:1-deoxy-D-xylulose-5-phosphate synthase N-terminal domain-containing protein [Acidimicrobiales bacterium]